MKTNKMNLMKLTASGLSLFLMLGLTSCGDKESATDGNDTETVETEDNRLIGDENLFAEWDVNKDGNLDEDEYAGGFFTSWDTDKDGNLTQAEWDAGLIYVEQTGQSWAEWDLDRDGIINHGEYRGGVRDHNWIHAWDSNGDRMLNQMEYTKGMSGRMKH